ncbi:MAG: hypothetical protein JF888_09455 [Candidatus Dormibacteraeota bacterium]|uniref:Uncharacterized protein n=1 Tax=Candidatus Dormiibacter inghamiae TaxID=3127013 RepID=A0A934NHE5_9BACT|nr:hypothetical protein [Candidatus Dormibacteraeota bacterium]MBJ7606784.1 hypothetical protein [Candidatus Dormibacteraeota bacterium]
MGSTDVTLKPQPLRVSVDKVGAVGPVSIDGIPDTFHIDIDKVPKILIGVDPVHVAVDSIPKIFLGIDPLDLSLRIKEFPSIRGHLPADFSVGISVMGMELLCLRLCGEAQIITEPYEPNPCEVCGRVHADGQGQGTHG